VHINNSTNRTSLPLDKSHAVGTSKQIRKWDEPANLVIIVGPKMEGVWLNNLLESAKNKGLTVELIGDGTQEISLSEIDGCIKSGALGPHTNTIVAMHGGIDAGEHLLGNSNSGNDTNTTEFLHRLRGHDTYIDNSMKNNAATKYKGTIHLMSCELGKIRGKIFKDEKLWNSGNYMLHAGSKIVTLETISSNALAIVDYVGECKRDHIAPDFSTMACRINEIAGDSLTLVGSNLEAPLLLSAPWKPEHTIPDYLLKTSITNKPGDKKKLIQGTQKDINQFIDAKKADRPSTNAHRIEKGVNMLATRIERKKFNEAMLLIDQFPEFAKGIVGGKIPIFYAIDANNTELLKMLIKAGASLTIQNSENITPLAQACINGYVDSAKFLMENGASVEDVFYEEEHSILQLATEHNHLNMVNYLGSINVKENYYYLNYQNNEGMTALHIAAKNGNIKIIQRLLEFGLDQEIEDDSKRSALWYAVESGNTESIKLLANNKKMINLSDITGFTPLHLAALNNNLNALKILIDAKADVLKQTNAGHSVLHYAVSSGNDRAVRMLVRQSNLINLRDLEGKTPLTTALAINNPQIIRILKNAQATI
jgi:ankyrin repeat protein